MYNSPFQAPVSITLDMTRFVSFGTSLTTCSVPQKRYQTLLVRASLTCGLSLEVDDTIAFLTPLQLLVLRSCSHRMVFFGSSLTMFLTLQKHFQTLPNMTRLVCYSALKKPFPWSELAK